MKTKIQEKFQTLFGEPGDLYASAGRINLIGEHTDYNGGYVFPGAIDCGIMAEIKVNGTQKVRAYSIDFDEFVGRAITRPPARSSSGRKTSATTRIPSITIWGRAIGTPW